MTQLLFAVQVHNMLDFQKPAACTDGGLKFKGAMHVAFLLLF